MASVKDPNFTKQINLSFLPIICQILACKGVIVGEMAMMVLVSAFSQSYLFTSGTKVCKLTNTWVGKLYKLLRWWWWE